MSPPSPAPELRIAMLMRRFDPAGGGAERYAVALLRELAARHHCTVFAQDLCTTLPGVTAVRVPQWLTRPRWLNLLCFALWTQWQTRRGFDIVHSHENLWHGNVHSVHVRTVRSQHFGGLSGWRRALRGLATCFSPRLVYYLAVEALRLRASPRRAVVAVSETLRSELEHGFSALAGQLDVLPPGVDLPAAITDRAACRARFGIAADRTLLLFIAGDYDKKGLPALLAALALLPREIELLVLGNATYIPAARGRATALGVAARVHFAGVLADPGPAYRAADMLVHPTLQDSFAMVVLEALAHALPVVVSGPAWCGIAAQLRDGDNALILADPRQPEAIAAAIGRICADPALRTRLATQGRQFASAHTWPALAAHHEALYRRVLSAQTPSKAPP